MFVAQNNQLHALLPIVARSKLLKFCYIILISFSFSCEGDKTKNSPATEQAGTTPTEETTTPGTGPKTILCFGDSITAGYGLDDTNFAFPALLQQKIDDKGLDYTVINSGVSGETTAGGRSRIDWVIKQPVDIFLLELGANDGLRGVALTETRANLQAIIDVVKTKSPQTTIILAGMEMPPNMGKTYTDEFRQLYADLAQTNALPFIPFILKDVGGVPELNLTDGIHPNEEGHKILAQTVWETLEPLL